MLGWRARPRGKQRAVRWGLGRGLAAAGADLYVVRYGIAANKLVEHGFGFVAADVAPETYEAFIKAESIGSFFGKNIKALPFKKYPAEQVAA